MVRFGILSIFSTLLAFTAFADVPSTRRSQAAYDKNAAFMAEEMEALGFEFGAPVYLRIVKQTATLQAFVQAEDGTYQPYRAWPICTYSGGLGPKAREGDGKSPEGFYAVRPRAMNPSSSYHLSFNLGYPNARDRSLGLTGSYLMVHGNCVSIGCYAMTDGGIEEIWTLMQGAYEGGQSSVPVHIFPFEMTAANLMAYSGSEHIKFWRDLAPAWQRFEDTGQPPSVTHRSGRYVLAGAQ